MAYPSPDVVYSYLQRLPRLVPARTEIIRIIREELPGQIAYTNAKNGINILPPTEIIAVPGQVDGSKSYLNHILVGFSTRLSVLGAGGFLQAEISVAANWIQPRLVGPEQLDDVDDVGAMLVACLLPALNNWKDPNDSPVWWQLFPKDITPLADYPQVGGVTVTWALKQTPNGNLWAAYGANFMNDDIQPDEDFEAEHTEDEPPPAEEPKEPAQPVAPLPPPAQVFREMNGERAKPRKLPDGPHHTFRPIKPVPPVNP